MRQSQYTYIGKMISRSPQFREMTNIKIYQTVALLSANRHESSPYFAPSYTSPYVCAMKKFSYRRNLINWETQFSLLSKRHMYMFFCKTAPIFCARNSRESRVARQIHHNCQALAHTSWVMSSQNLPSAPRRSAIMSVISLDTSPSIWECFLSVNLAFFTPPQKIWWSTGVC